MVTNHPSAERLRGELSQLVARTETLFLGMANRYPELQSEMELGFQAARRQMAQLDDGSKGSALLQQTRARADESTRRFGEIHVDDDRIIDQLDRAGTGVAELGRVIYRIREDSEEMQLVSLNAMTVAVKAGNSGRAFSYITDELRRLAARTIDDTQQVTETGAELADRFRAFSETLSSTQERLNNLFARFSERADAIVAVYDQATKRMRNELRRILADAESVRPQIGKIMETVQLQDIIRQSVDHVLLALDEYGDEAFLGSTDGNLDRYVEQVQLARLGNEVLADVKTTLRRSIDTFTNASTMTDETIGRVAEDRERFFAQSDGSDENDVALLFDRNHADIERLLADLGEAQTAKDQLLDQSRELLVRVGQVESQLQGFDPLVRRFHNIDVASRIEVAKQPVLQSMASTIDAMHELTGTIDTDVSQSLEETATFIATTQRVIEAFSRVQSKEREETDRFSHTMYTALDALTEARERIAATVSGFSVFTTRFRDAFRTTSDDLSQLSTLADQLSASQAQLVQMENVAQENLTRALGERGIETWEIHRDDLRRIVDRFTIYAHKEAAGKIMGIDMGESIEHGEVTLF